MNAFKDKVRWLSVRVCWGY